MLVLFDKNYHSSLWGFIGLYSKKVKEYNKNCEDFKEFINLLKSSRKNN